MTESTKSSFLYPPYVDAAPAHTAAYLWPIVLGLLEREPGGGGPVGLRVLDAGCGNGAFARVLADRGFDVAGFDLSESGIAQARGQGGNARFEVASATEDPVPLFGHDFDAVTSLEVVEHIGDPRSYARAMFGALRPGGLFVVSTPYHGYLKNVALAVTGKMDAHFTALWDGGHIKFWSRRTLGILLEEAGFRDVRFHGSGRIPFLWKSMILSARKPRPAAGKS